MMFVDCACECSRRTTVISRDARWAVRKGAQTPSRSSPTPEENERREHLISHRASQTFTHEVKDTRASSHSHRQTNATSGAISTKTDPEMFPPSDCSIPRALPCGAGRRYASRRQGRAGGARRSGVWGDTGRHGGRHGPEQAGCVSGTPQGGGMMTR